MKRTDIIPNENALVDLLQKDQIGRNSDLADFAGILKAVEGSFSIFLDAEWGSGKTIFVKQLECLLSAANPQVKSLASTEGLLTNASALTAFNELDSFLPVYYNAWENDHWDDPLPSIAAAIAASENATCSFSSDTSTANAIFASLDAVLQITGHGSIASLKENVLGKNLVESYQNRETLRHAISDLVETILSERANTLLLIVDELDRCKPFFAMRVLEELKDLFDNDQIIILYSINASQLSHVVEGLYGQGFNGKQYLSRFYDLRVPLRYVEPASYLNAIGFPKSSNRFDVISSGMANAYAMSMRDANRFFTILAEARPQAISQKRGFGNDLIPAFANAALVPVMLALKIAKPDTYSAIIQHLDPVKLYDAFILCDEAMRFMDATWGTYKIPPEGEFFSEEEKKTARIELLEALLYEIWCTDYSNPKKQHAREVVGHSWEIDSLPHLASVI